MLKPLDTKHSLSCSEKNGAHEVHQARIAAAAIILSVAENVAWLRTAENGQTSVGIIGGQPLLVVGFRWRKSQPRFSPVPRRRKKPLPRKTAPLPLACLQRQPHRSGSRRGHAGAGT